MEDEVAFLATTKPVGKSPLKIPERNEQFVYTAGRAFSFWPTVNGNGATFLEEDIAPLFNHATDTNLTWRGKLVNANHEIGKESSKMVIGTIIDEAYIPGVGIDVLNQLDRRQLEAYEIEAEDFAAGGEYSKQSIELRRDIPKSKYIVLRAPGNPDLAKQQVFSAEEAAALGIRRTSYSDPLGPYMHEGKYKVVEAITPKRVWGIGILSKPQADSTALIYDYAASQEYADMSDLADKYKNTPPMTMTDDSQSSLPNDAFAICDDGDETLAQGSSVKRQLPLYESKAKYDASNPHAGLIKAAVDVLNGKGKTKFTPALHAEANKRVRNAHNQISEGDKKMALSAEEKAALVDPLESELAGLRKDIKTKQDEAAELERSKVLELQSKDNEIAALNETIKKLTEKIASDELADKVDSRMAELSKVEGFEVKADEKASLLEAIGQESDAEFRVRVLSAKNASLEAKLKSGKPGKPSADESAALDGLNSDNADNSAKNPYSLLTKK